MSSEWKSETCETCDFTILVGHVVEGKTTGWVLKCFVSPPQHTGDDEQWDDGVGIAVTNTTHACSQWERATTEAVR